MKVKWCRSKLIFPRFPGHETKQQTGEFLGTPPDKSYRARTNRAREAYYLQLRRGSVGTQREVCHRMDPAEASCVGGRIYEINPLQCPRCKSEMRIIAFITNEREVSKIAHSLGIPHSTAPPPIPRAPQQELFDEMPRDEFI